MGWFKKVLSFVFKSVVRPGLDVFLERYMEIGKDIVLQVITSSPDVPFHEIKSEAFRRVKEVTAQQKDTWISILVDLAYEGLRATRSASQTRP
jgi:hypothetical protein